MNNPISKAEADRALAEIGIPVERPLMTQLSRFDPWKDPIGVIDAYRIAKREISDLQLALVGIFLAQDDPEAFYVYRSVTDHAKGDPGIHLFTDSEVVGDVEVNAFQVASDVIIQKSLREGFGLTVTEAMWKGKPVVGGNVGGISEQIRDGENGFLVNSPEECAKRVVELLRDPKLAERIGLAGRESARKNYLIPRLVRDYLRLLGELNSGRVSVKM
jgi:trehalose synthase